MHKILLIEKSATQRHVLAKMLLRHGHDITMAENCEVGLHLLLDAQQDECPFSSVVLGWPQFGKIPDHAMLDHLTRPEFSHVPVLVMAQETDANMHNWAARRPLTAIILWDTYHDVTDSLEKLSNSREKEGKDSGEPLDTDNQIRVLFVDDSSTVRAIYKRLLNKNGYQTDVAENAEQALKLAEKNQYDITITDYFMPKINGDELCRRLRDNPATNHIITAIITGAYLDEVIKDSLQAGAVECMFKNEANELFLARIAVMSRMVRAKNSIDGQRNRLEGILNSVGEGVYGVSQEGVVTFINPAALQMLGYENDQKIIGQPPHELFHHSDEDGSPIARDKSFIQQAYGSGYEVYSRETVFWNQAKKTIPVECTIYPLRILGKQEGSVVAFKDISERKDLEKKLRWQATHDPLTELLNRRFFEEALDNEVNRLARSSEVSCLVYIDLDRFKYINDTAGHTAGDQLLVKIARQLRNRLRSSDLLTRIGGDEFAVIMRNVDPEQVLESADTFRELLQDCTFNYGGKNYKINGSVGVAIINNRSQSPGEVLVNADIACHIAKSKGRNQTHLYIPENETQTTMDLDLGWSARLREALENDSLRLYYQPILPLADLDLNNLPESGDLWSHLQAQRPETQMYEVLMRLQGHDGDIILPGAFIPTAERFNLMREIDRWVVSHAIEQLYNIHKTRTDIHFSINISGQTVSDENFLPFMQDLLNRYTIDPSAITLEITETTAIENLESAQKMIYELNTLGCRFALDDFGSGFSSFTHLKHLLVEFIKIDGSFVQGMEEANIDHTMVSSINDIAHSLGRHTIAEYVENVSILRLLKVVGVDYVQGNCISEPLEELPVDIEVSTRGKVVSLNR
jgi:diguanylate cyclase (GGDEF)-like protein/PAS domain S-box-containing protein